ncbi:MAG: RDD family protein [Candidatus Saccharicenans sp.]|nr:RDD family protein [Candidatus Saccharicenans sp.]
MKSRFSRLFPRNKAHPAQAGFIRRGLAFGLDGMIIAILSSIVYSGYSELVARIRHEPSPVAGVVQSIREGGSATWSPQKGLQTGTDKKGEYLELLKDLLPDEEFQKASALTAEEIEKNYRTALARARIRQAEERLGGSSGEGLGNRAYKVIKEYLITMLYFVLFFRYGGRTPGKRLFGLKVIDLEGKPRLSWYQCFERAHGYVCSGLFASLGFWQVLWDRHGLTMHDKIADTTVIRWSSPARNRKEKAREKKNR